MAYVGRQLLAVLYFGNTKYACLITEAVWLKLIFTAACKRCPYAVAPHAVTKTLPGLARRVTFVTGNPHFLTIRPFTLELGSINAKVMRNAYS